MFVLSTALTASEVGQFVARHWRNIAFFKRVKSLKEARRTKIQHLSICGQFVGDHFAVDIPHLKPLKT